MLVSSDGSSLPNWSTAKRMQPRYISILAFRSVHAEPGCSWSTALVMQHCSQAYQLWFVFLLGYLAEDAFGFALVKRSNGKRALTLVVACSQHHDAAVIADEALCNPAGLGPWPPLSCCHELCLYNLLEDTSLCTIWSSGSNAGSCSSGSHARASSWCIGSDAHTVASQVSETQQKPAVHVCITLMVTLWPAVSGRSSPNFLNTAGCLSSVLIEPG